MEIREPKHFIKICVSRELTDVEFDDMTDIVDTEVGDIVGSDDVIEYTNEANLMCYMFQLTTDIEHSEQGSLSSDIVSHEIDQMLPIGLKWEMETSADVIKLNIPINATPAQEDEEALAYFRNILKA